MDDRADEAGRVHAPSTPDLVAADPTERLLAWVASARVDEGARERGRRHWLERQAREETTIGGVLLDLAERRTPSVVSTRRRSLRGVIRAVGADFTVVTGRHIGDTLIPFRSIEQVRSAPGEAPVDGYRPFAAEVVMGEALAHLAIDQPGVWVVSGRAEARGRLRSSGIDVVTVITEAPERETLHVLHSAIDHLVITDR